MNILRWILVLPAAFAGWLLGIEVGFLIDGLSNITCPKHYQVSETCAAPWTPLVAEFAITTGAAVAAVAIVGFTALMAPQWRARVAWVGEHAMPPRAFMLRQPGVTTRNLPWRYVRRLLSGPFRLAR